MKKDPPSGPEEHSKAYIFPLSSSNFFARLTFISDMAIAAASALLLPFASNSASVSASLWAPCAFRRQRFACKSHLAC